MAFWKLVNKIIPVTVISATAIFFGMALSENWENVRTVSLAPDIYSISGTLLFVVAVMFSGQLWGKLLNTFSPEKKISSRNAIRIYCASWILKYLPGQAGSYLNKVAWGIKNGFGKKVITNSFLYEYALMLFSSLLISGPIILLLLFETLDENYTLFLPLLITLPFLVVLKRSLFHKIINYLFRKLRNQEISRDLFLSSRQLISLQLQYLIPRIITGLGFVFIAHSCLTVPPDLYLPLLGIYVLAGIVGVSAIFVPSGIGVREAVIVLFTSQYFTLEQAIMLSIIARFYATVADLAILGIYLYLNKWKLQQQ